jgi:hypothetical protein
MATSFRTRRIGIPTTALIALTLLGGCAAEPDQALTLAQTKSPVQLLRNEAASRVPADAVDSIVTSQDESTACRTVETDPDGLLRSWRSVVRYALKYGDAYDGERIVADLAASFVDQGWVEGSYGTAAIVELSRDGSETTIHISESPGDAEARTGAQVQLTVAGPCVLTKGADSDEVRLLDGAEG